MGFPGIFKMADPPPLVATSSGKWQPIRQQLNMADQYEARMTHSRWLTPPLVAPPSGRKHIVYIYTGFSYTVTTY